MGKVVLHIGGQRTGTTFLQKCIFNRIDFFRNGIFFYSNENIWTDLWDTFDDRWDRLLLLKEQFPDARILFGKRERKPLLKSVYKKYVAQGGTLPFCDFDEVINMKKLDHRKYVHQLKKNFDDVMVYNHRDLVCDRDRVIRDMCKWMGVPAPKYTVKWHNVGYGKEMLPIARQLNKLFKNDFNPHGVIPCHYYFLPHRVLYQDVVMPRFRRKI